MNEGSDHYERQIIPKKSNRIDEDDSNRKKGKKNRRRDNDYPLSEEPPREEPRNRVTRPAEHTASRRNEEDLTFQQLCCIFSAYRPATIRSVLVANNYNKAEATNALCELGPDNEEKGGNEFEGM